MIAVDIQINGLDNIIKGFQRRPDVVKRYVNNAINKSIFKLKRRQVIEIFNSKHRVLSVQVIFSGHLILVL